jgi:50S ribosomal subunit-associated GTPase HflX
MVGVQIGSGSGQVLSLEDSLAELELLAETAGIDVLATLTQNLRRLIRAHLLEAGKWKNSGCWRKNWAWGLSCSMRSFRRGIT